MNADATYLHRSNCKVPIMVVVATGAVTAALLPSHHCCDHRCRHRSRTVTHIVC